MKSSKILVLSLLLVSTQVLGFVGPEDAEALFAEPIKNIRTFNDIVTITTQDMDNPDSDISGVIRVPEADLIQLQETNGTLSWEDIQWNEGIFNSYGLAIQPDQSISLNIQKIQDALNYFAYLNELDEEQRSREIQFIHSPRIPGNKSAFEKNVSNFNEWNRFIAPQGIIVNNVHDQGIFEIIN